MKDYSFFFKLSLFPLFPLSLPLPSQSPLLPLSSPHHHLPRLPLSSHQPPHGSSGEEDAEISEELEVYRTLFESTGFDVEGDPDEPLELTLSSVNGRNGEKEWGTTLAGKLLEERRRGGEGMDWLWEAYEKGEKNRGKQGSVVRKKESEVFDDNGEEKDYEGGNGRIPCLKYPSVKMNLRVSKVVKGIGGGWLKKEVLGQVNSCMSRFDY